MSALSLRSSLRLVTVSRAGRGLWRTAPGLSMTVRHGGGGGPRPEPNFVEPNGFLFNEKPLLPGEKRKKEEWENIFVYGMGFCFLLIVIMALFKPDTSVSAWAREEALRRLEEKEAALKDETVTVTD